MVFGGGITPDLTAPGVTPDLTAPTYFQAPQNYGKMFFFMFPVLFSKFPTSGKLPTAPGKIKNRWGGKGFTWAENNFRALREKNL